MDDIWEPQVLMEQSALTAQTIPSQHLHRGEFHIR